MSEPIVLEIHNRHRYDTLFRVRAHWGSLPEGSALTIALLGLPAGKGPPADPAAAALFPPTIEAGDGRQVTLDPTRVHRLAPDKDRQSDLPEFPIKGGQSVFAAIRVQTPPTLPRGRAKFNLVQLESDRVIGGCTIEVRAPQS
jgi:hypothetical protein